MDLTSTINTLYALPPLPPFLDLVAEFNWAYDGSQLGPHTSRSFAIEYDSYKTDFCNDTDSNHIGVNTNWTCHSEATVEVSNIARLDSGKDLWSWIDYKADSTRLTVYLSLTSDKPSTPALDKSIDLCNVFTDINTTRPPYYYPGFAGAAGSGEVSQPLSVWNKKHIGSIERIITEIV